MSACVIERMSRRANATLKWAFSKASRPFSVVSAQMPSLSARYRLANAATVMDAGAASRPSSISRAATRASARLSEARAPRVRRTVRPSTLRCTIQLSCPFSRAHCAAEAPAPALCDPIVFYQSDEPYRPPHEFRSKSPHSLGHRPGQYGVADLRVANPRSNAPHARPKSVRIQSLIPGPSGPHFPTISPKVCYTICI